MENKNQPINQNPDNNNRGANPASSSGNNPTERSEKEKFLDMTILKIEKYFQQKLSSGEVTNRVRFLIANNSNFTNSEKWEIEAELQKRWKRKNENKGKSQELVLINKNLDLIIDRDEPLVEIFTSKSKERLSKTIATNPLEISRGNVGIPKPQNELYKMSESQRLAERENYQGIDRILYDRLCRKVGKYQVHGGNQFFHNTAVWTIPAYAEILSNRLMNSRDNLGIMLEQSFSVNEVKEIISELGISKSVNRLGDLEKIKVMINDREKALLSEIEKKEKNLEQVKTDGEEKLKEKDGEKGRLLEQLEAEQKENERLSEVKEKNQEWNQKLRKNITELTEEKKKVIDSLTKEIAELKTEEKRFKEEIARKIQEEARQEKLKLEALNQAQKALQSKEQVSIETLQKKHAELEKNAKTQEAINELLKTKLADYLKYLERLEAEKLAGITHYDYLNSSWKIIHNENTLLSKEIIDQSRELVTVKENLANLGNSYQELETAHEELEGKERTTRHNYNFEKKQHEQYKEWYNKAEAKKNELERAELELNSQVRTLKYDLTTATNAAEVLNKRWEEADKSRREWEIKARTTEATLERKEAELKLTEKSREELQKEITGGWLYQKACWLGEKTYFFAIKKAIGNFVWAVGLIVILFIIFLGILILKAGLLPILTLLFSRKRKSRKKAKKEVNEQDKNEGNIIDILPENNLPRLSQEEAQELKNQITELQNQLKIAKEQKAVIEVEPEKEIPDKFSQPSKPVKPSNTKKKKVKPKSKTK